MKSVCSGIEIVLNYSGRTGKKWQGVFIRNGSKRFDIESALGCQIERYTSFEDVGYYV